MLLRPRRGFANIPTPGHRNWVGFSRIDRPMDVCAPYTVTKQRWFGVQVLYFLGDAQISRSNGIQLVEGRVTNEPVVDAPSCVSERRWAYVDHLTSFLKGKFA
mmetsp:Transcript_8910/g.13795  ORF Transcript_8910/g.13795 Transcript_8910/m.13795 type:complete len:103 (-) Transcript_8910:234-542(-)